MPDGSLPKTIVLDGGQQLAGTSPVFSGFIGDDERERDERERIAKRARAVRILFQALTMTSAALEAASTGDLLAADPLAIPPVPESRLGTPSSHTSGATTSAATPAKKPSTGAPAKSGHRSEPKLSMAVEPDLLAANPFKPDAADANEKARLFLLQKAGDEVRRYRVSMEPEAYQAFVARYNLERAAYKKIARAFEKFSVPAARSDLERPFLADYEKFRASIEREINKRLEAAFKTRRGTERKRPTARYYVKDGVESFDRLRALMTAQANKIGDESYILTTLALKATLNKKEGDVFSLTDQLANIRYAGIFHQKLRELADRTRHELSKIDETVVAIPRKKATARVRELFTQAKNVVCDRQARNTALRHAFIGVGTSYLAKTGVTLLIGKAGIAAAFTAAAAATTLPLWVPIALTGLATGALASVAARALSVSIRTAVAVNAARRKGETVNKKLIKNTFMNSLPNKKGMIIGLAFGSLGGAVGALASESHLLHSLGHNPHTAPQPHVAAAAPAVASASLPPRVALSQPVSSPVPAVSPGPSVSSLAPAASATHLMPSQPVANVPPVLASPALHQLPISGVPAVAPNAPVTMTQMDALLKSDDFSRYAGLRKAALTAFGRGHNDRGVARVAEIVHRAINGHGHTPGSQLAGARLNHIAARFAEQNGMHDSAARTAFANEAVSDLNGLGGARDIPAAEKFAELAGGKAGRAVINFIARHHLLAPNAA